MNPAAFTISLAFAIVALVGYLLAVPALVAFFAICVLASETMEAWKEWKRQRAAALRGHKEEG